MKLLHAADFHLDSAFRALPPEKAAARRAEQRQNLEALGELCHAEGCQMALLSGDLFDGREVSRQSLDALKALLADLGVPVCIAPGNHDYYAPDSPYARESWPDNVRIFTDEAPASIAFPELDCRVWGAAFRQIDCPPLSGFCATGTERYQIMVLHGDPSGAPSPSRAVTKEAAAASNLDYLALGHIHRAGSFRAGRTLCAWPGCPMGRGFDETGPKGALVVTLEETAQARFCPLPGRQYESLTVDPSEDPLVSILSSLPADTRQDIYRITLRGPGQVDLPALEAALSGRFYHLILKDETTPPRDLWESAGEDTLEGLYFRLLRDAMAGSDTDTRRQLTLAAQLSRQFLDGEEVALP